MEDASQLAAQQKYSAKDSYLGCAVSALQIDTVGAMLDMLRS
jgi:hypothetical protein